MPHQTALLVIDDRLLFIGSRKCFHISRAASSLLLRYLKSHIGFISHRADGSASDITPVASSPAHSAGRAARQASADIAPREPYYVRRRATPFADIASFPSPHYCSAAA